MAGTTSARIAFTFAGYGLPLFKASHGPMCRTGSRSRRYGARPAFYASQRPTAKRRTLIRRSFLKNPKLRTQRGFVRVSLRGQRDQLLSPHLVYALLLRELHLVHELRLQHEPRRFADQFSGELRACPRSWPPSIASPTPRSLRNYFSNLSTAACGQLRVFNGEMLGLSS